MSESLSHRSNDQLEFAIPVENVKAQIQAIQQLMKVAMKENEHYGVIPGCNKPSLLKPGAEKLSMMFRLSPQYTITRREHGGGHVEFEVVCRLTNIRTNEMWGEGVGSCSTLETKFRYRKAEQICPNCGKPAIVKGKKEYGGGWLCYKKKDGCGAKFADGDPEIENQNMGRVEHDNPSDYYNTVLKMAKKRAHVDAILTATAASDIFTQDIEDLVDNGVIDVAPSGKSNVTPPPKRTVVVEHEPEREPVKVQTGETEPPDDVPLATDDPDRPNFTNDVYGRLDSMIYDYCKGNSNNMKSVYKTLTTFKGTDGKERYCLDVEQLKRWKPGSAEKAKRQLEQRMAMGTKFTFELE